MEKTIESLAIMRYDDKRKLLFIVCDGKVSCGMCHHRRGGRGSAGCTFACMWTEALIDSEPH